MMWDYITLSDETQIAYSEIQEDGTVEVGIERPVPMGFDSASCTLPSRKWNNIVGFSSSEIRELDALLSDNAPFIFELAQRHAQEKTVA